MDLSEFKTWCDQKRGRRSEAGQALGVSKQHLCDWFSNPPRRKPTDEQLREIGTFMEYQTSISIPDASGVLSMPLIQESTRECAQRSTQDVPDGLHINQYGVLVNEYNEMPDDPNYVSPPMTPEEKTLSDRVLAELDFTALFR